MNDWLYVIQIRLFVFLKIQFQYKYFIQVQFKIRDMSRVELEDSHKPVLYLIFDNPPEIDSKKDKCAFMDEVFEYSSTYFLTLYYYIKTQSRYQKSVSQNNYDRS